MADGGGQRTEELAALEGYGGGVSKDLQKCRGHRVTRVDGFLEAKVG